jgi:NADPH2:quinone reductase
MKTKAIRIHKTGGPEVLQLDEIELAAPGPGEIRVRNKAVGLNFIETYFRSGLYPVKFPFALGSEAAGVVDAVGADVTNLKPGDRVAYNSAGAYAELTNLPAWRAVKIPDAVADEAAAALMLKGMTAQYLLRQTYRLEKGQTILFHAAAGGVGLIATQWAKHLGATVIGTVGSDDKAALASAHGCDHVINYRRENVPERVKELTRGRKLPVVYDGVGKDTFPMSLDCLAPRGMLVSFGNASGPVTGVDLGILASKGSLYVTRPTLAHYSNTPESFAAAAREVFDTVASGAIKVQVNQRYALADAASAHRDLEARKTTGATVLVP